MNIFVLSRGIPSEKDPHWGCFEKDQAEALQKMGHKVTVFCVSRKLRNSKGKIDYDELKSGIKKIKINNINYYSLFYFTSFILNKLTFNIFSVKLSILKLKILFKKMIRDEGRPDLIYSHYLFNTYFAIKLKKTFNVPVIALEHWSELAYDNIDPKFLNMGTLTYPQVDQLLVVSEFLKHNIFKHFKISSKIVPNVLGKEFIETPINFNPHSNFKFVTIGKLIERKRFDLLISAFKKADLPDNCQLEIIGYGPLEKDLRLQIETLELKNKIILSGTKNKKEIIEILSNSDAFVLSSKSETFGVVLIEALSRGLPCISTRCGGSEGIINEDNGILCNVDDENSLKDALLLMYKNINTYDRKKIITKTLDEYSDDAIGKKLENIFKTIIK